MSLTESPPGGVRVAPPAPAAYRRAPERSPFRPDVEGLRAVAIALVVLSHAGVRAMRGGYVGVDVFFVISGFLITRLLVGELERTGRISLPRFYARRIKRLLPQAILAIVCVAVASALLLPPTRAAQAAHDVMAAGGYAMNVRLSAEAVDYFAQGEADGPLDHFWSLAVEEQFYLAWPLLLLLLARIPRLRRAAIVAALCSIAGASLLYAMHATHVAPTSAYFDTRGRAWELAVGGLLVFALGSRRLPFAAAAAAAWAGVLAIGIAAVRYDARTAFPGLPALLPTLGAAALIAGGTSARRAVPTRLLATRPMQYLGRLSYAWYVWHWPVLVFAAVVLGPLSAPAALLVLGVSLVPTLLTHHLMEEPVRRSRLHARRPRAILAAAPAGALAALCAAALVVAALPSEPSLARGEVKGAGALEKSTTIQNRARAVVPSPLKADKDRGRPVDDGCLIDGTPRWSHCIYGDRSSKTTVVLFGDSHAFQYFTPIERIAKRRGWRLVEQTRQGCPPADALVWATFLGRAYPECGTWHGDALKRIARAHPAMIIAAGSAHYDVVQDGNRLGGPPNLQALTDGYSRMLSRLRTITPNVVYVTDSPRPPQYIPDCVAQNMHHLRRCAFPRARAVENEQAIKAAAEQIDGIHVVDPTPEFCPRDLCPAVIGNVIVYRNSGHVTDTYTRTMTGWFSKRVPKKLRR